MATTSSSSPNFAGQVGTLRGASTYNAFLSREFLSNLDPLLCFDKFGMIQNIPMHEGRGVEFERVASFSTAEVPADEGTTGDAISVSNTRYQSTLLQYTSHLTYTDWLKENSFRDYMMRYTNRFKQQMAATRDKVVRTELETSSNTLFSNGTVVTDLDTPLTSNVMLNGIRQLQNNNAAPLTSYYKGLVNKEQVAISPCYIMFIHPDQIADLLSINGFIQARFYQQAPLHTGEVGQFHNIRFISTTQVSKTAGGNTNVSSSGMLNDATNNYYYKNFLMGADSFAISELSGKTSGIILKKLGSAGSDDPNSQRGSLGWSMNMAAKIVQPDALYMVHACASKLS